MTPSSMKFTRSTSLVWILPFILLFTSVQTDATHAKPHIIMILADDLGWHDVSWTGSSAQTPNLERLARKGIILDQFYAQPSCTPSRAALLTGRYPHTIGRQLGVIRPLSPTGLTLEVPTLAEELKDLGYSTHIIGKWHLGFCNRKYIPTSRGFDSFQGFLVGAQNYYSHLRVTTTPGSSTLVAGYDFWHNNTVDWEARGRYSPPYMLNQLRQLLTSRRPNKPMFLYLPLQLVHGPLQVPGRYTKPYQWVQNKKRRMLLGMVSAMDEMVGQVVGLLRSTGHYHNSVIAFTSDNGGAIKESGYNWPLRGRKGTSWEGGTRVPAFVHSPLLKRTGKTLKNVFHITDWFPTFLGLAGGTPSPDIDGVDQWGAIQGTAPPHPRKHMIYTLKKRSSTIRGAIRNREYKLLVGTHASYKWYIPPEVDPGRDFFRNITRSYVGIEEMGAGLHQRSDAPTTGSEWEDVTSQPLDPIISTGLNSKSVNYSSEEKLKSDPTSKLELESPFPVEVMTAVTPLDNFLKSSPSSLSEKFESPITLIDSTESEPSSFISSASLTSLDGEHNSSVETSILTLRKRVRGSPLNDYSYDDEDTVEDADYGDEDTVEDVAARDDLFVVPTREEITATALLSSKDTELYLYNLRDDPTERTNLRWSKPAVVKELLSLLLAELPRVVPPDAPRNDPKGSPGQHGGVWRPGWC